MDNKRKLTKEGFLKLKKELKILKKEKRPKTVKRLEIARAMGDLSENSGYTSAKQELGFIDRKILEIETTLKVVQVVDEKPQTDTVSIGNKITVQVKNKNEIYQIVGAYEADLMNKKISAFSPLGKALINRKVNDTVSVDTPSGKITYKILKIE